MQAQQHQGHGATIEAFRYEMDVLAAALPGDEGRANPVRHRLVTLDPACDGADLHLPGVLRTLAPGRTFDRREQTEVRAHAILSGWGCISQISSDGRRQIHLLALPGDLMIVSGAFGPSLGMTALTRLEIATARPDEGAPDATFGRVERISDQMNQALMLSQIVRLGRQYAVERLSHLILELRDRLLLAGLGDRRRFYMPLTQEALGDLLGLTSVHINRTLQSMRRDGLIRLSGRMIELLQPDTLASLSDYRPFWPMPADG